MLNKFIKCKILSVLGVGDGGGTGYNCSLNTCSVCSLVNVVLLVPRAGDNQSVRRRTLNHCFSRIQSELLPMRTINKFCVLGTPEWKLRTSHHDLTFWCDISLELKSGSSYQGSLSGSDVICKGKHPTTPYISPMCFENYPAFSRWTSEALTISMFLAGEGEGEGVKVGWRQEGEEEEEKE